MRPSNTVVYLGIAGGILAVSTSAIFIRYAQEEAPSLAIAALRLTFATLLLFPFIYKSYRPELARLTRADLGLGLLSGVFLALHFATWISSLEFTSVSSSVVLVSSTPLWVALISPALLKEKLGKTALLGMILALLGGTLVAMNDLCAWQGQLTCQPPETLLAQNSLPGNLLALSGAWMATGYLIIGRKLRAKLSLPAYIFVVYGMAAAALLLLMLAAGQSPFGYAPLTYFWLLLLAIVPQLLGHSTFNWALGFLPASHVAITLLGEPIGSTILAFLLLQESPGTLELLGGALILLGILAASQRQNESA